MPRSSVFLSVSTERRFPARESGWPSASGSWSVTMAASGWIRKRAGVRLFISHCPQTRAIFQGGKMAEESGDRKIQILLIEDNPADVELLRRALQGAQLDYELILLEDGAEALAFLRRLEADKAESSPDL